MEIKIIISDIASNLPEAKLSISAPDEASNPSANDAQSGGVAAPSGTPSASEPGTLHELLQRAAALGAIAAGPAPDLAGSGEMGAPQQFITAHADTVIAASEGESAGAAPGSGMLMETFTTAES